MMVILKLVPKVVWVGVAAAVLGLMLVPSFVRAEDSCGFISILLGCDQQQQAAEAQGALEVQKQDLANEAEQQAYNAKVAFEQLAVEREKAALAAQTETERTQIMGQVEVARARSQQESDKLNALVSERMNQTNAQATVNLAALQADTVKHVADTQVVVESNRIDALVWVAIIAAVCATGYGVHAYNKRKTVEAKLAAFKLLPPEARQIAAMLENDGVTYDLTPAGQVRTRHPATGQWVIAKGQ